MKVYINTIKKLIPIAWVTFLVIGFLDFWYLEILDTYKVFDMTLKYLWPLAIIFSIPLVWWIIDWYDRFKYPKYRVIINSLLYSIIISFFNFMTLQGHVSLYNRIIGNQKEVQIEGRIKEIEIERKIFYLTITCNENSNEIILKVNKENRLLKKEGDDITLKLLKGGLGILYKK